MNWFKELLHRAMGRLSSLFPARLPDHLLTGDRGEQKAYRFLRRQGYRIVAAKFRTPRHNGEIDLIGWDHGTLCFVEVKTRSNEGLRPPAAAVNLAKQEHILAVARDYVRRLPGRYPPACRFDVVSVVLRGNSGKTEIHLHKGAFDWNAGRRRPDWREVYRS